jgi:hypothetical protein
MTTTPDQPFPDDEQPDSDRTQPSSSPGSSPGVEIGMSDEGGTFEPEEDPDPEA